MATSDSRLQVVILAAGKGVRMRSQLPKVLHRVCGRSLVHRALRAAAALEPARAVVVIGFGEPLMREELARLSKLDAFSALPILPVLQDEQLGTGHAVQMAAVDLKGDASTVLIMPGDCPLVSPEDLKHFVGVHRESGSVLSFLTAEIPNPDGFGRVVRDRTGKVEAIVEHKDANAEQRAIREINSSIYCCDREFLLSALSDLKNDNAQGEYYLTDIVPIAVKSGARVEAVLIPNSKAVLGANNRAELSALEAMRREEINRHWMEAGVTMEDPGRTYIEEDVRIEADVFLGSGTRLRGQTVIKWGAVIDGDTVIADSTIGEGTHIKFSCMVDGSRVGPGCAVGPFAHLRPGSELHEQVKIGNFVETKKAVFEKGSKANHLSYLGDARVGAQANVGAGTITCNYDGTSKSKTEIGRGAFVGSNSCLVAPVTIGDEAYVAAGSTITKPVPAGALGIGRARQEVLEGWVAKKKKKSKK